MPMFNFGNSKSGGGGFFGGSKEDSENANQNQNPNQNQNANPGNENDSGNDSQQNNLTPNPWAAKVDNESGGDNSPPNNAQNQNTNQGGPGSDNDAANTFNSFVDSLNFTDGVNLGEVGKALGLEEGTDLAPLGNVLQEVGKNAFRQSMLFANKVMDKRLEGAIEQAVEKTTGKVNSDRAYERLFEQMPALNTDEHGPVAKAVMSGFVKQGQGVDEAIQNTGKYFEKMTRDLAKSLGLVAPTGGGNGQFGEPQFDNNVSERAYPGFGSREREPDWVKYLTS